MAIKVRKTIYAPLKFWQVVEFSKILLKFKSQSKLVTDAVTLFLEECLSEHVSENRTNSQMSLEMLRYLRQEVFKLRHPPEEKKQ